MSVTAEGATGAEFLGMREGASAAVSDGGQLRVRYNGSFGRGEYSENGGPWLPFSSAGPISQTPFTCPAGVVVGEAVALNGADTVAKANAAAAGTKPAIGFVTQKPTATTCELQYGGELAAFVGLTPGATYYLAEVDGDVTATKPTTNGSIQQVVGWARNATTLILNLEPNPVTVVA